MPTVRAQAKSSVILQIGGILSIGAGVGVGEVQRRKYPLGSPGNPNLPVPYTGAAQSYGPFDTIAVFNISCTEGQLPYEFTTPTGIKTPRYQKTLGPYSNTTVYVAAGSQLTITGTGTAFIIERGAGSSQINFNGLDITINPVNYVRIFEVITANANLLIDTAWYAGPGKPVFSQAPTISPTTGDTNTTFTATDGAADAPITVIMWLLDGQDMGSAVTIKPAHAGTLIRRNIATNAGGTTISDSAPITVGVPQVIPITISGGFADGKFGVPYDSGSLIVTPPSGKTKVVYQADIDLLTLHGLAYNGNTHKVTGSYIQ